MERKVVLNMIADEKRGAFVEGGKVKEWLFEHGDETIGAGTIIVGKVEDIIPGMEAAFVQIGEGKNGYLYRNELRAYQMFIHDHPNETPPSIGSLITKGQKIVVQVKKEAAGTKDARLTEMLSLPGKYTVFLPYNKHVAVSKKIRTEDSRDFWREKGKVWVRDNEGIIIRTNAEQVEENIVFAELGRLRRLFHELVERAERETATPKVIFNESSLLYRVIRDYFTDGDTWVIVDTVTEYEHLVKLASDESKERIHLFQGKDDIFSAYKLNKDLEKAIRSHVWLKNGAFLIIEKTEALTIIDVNTGKFLGKENLRDTVLKTNVEAAHAVAEQIRLRNIGGIILIDFIDMKEEKDKEEVLRTLKKASAVDKTLTNVAGFTKFGLVEMTRKKTRKSIDNFLLENCPTCGGTGKLNSVTSTLSALKRDLHALRYTDAEAILIDVEPRLFEALLVEEKGSTLKDLEAYSDKGLYVLLDEELLGKSVNYAIRSLGKEDEIKAMWERRKKRKE